mmetsp:Transcript_7812/g.22245  ORF Transcript_7812/g.22245 Transcript_7812/m.22245 type:complete len:388 (+) Transcript_7812:127-1290(+)
MLAVKTPGKHSHDEEQVQLLKAAPDPISPNQLPSIISLPRSSSRGIHRIGCLQAALWATVLALAVVGLLAIGAPRGDMHGRRGDSVQLKLQSITDTLFSVISPKETKSLALQTGSQSTWTGSHKLSAPEQQQKLYTRGPLLSEPDSGVQTESKNTHVRSGSVLPVHGRSPGNDSISTGGHGRSTAKVLVLEQHMPKEGLISTGGETLVGKRSTATTHVEESKPEAVGKEFFWSACQDDESFHCYDHKGSMYAVSTATATWEGAEERCQQLGGGHLASIHNDRENQYVAAKLPGKVDFWIGLRYDEQEKEWKWNDGEVMAFQSWGKENGRAPKNHGLGGKHGPQLCGSSNYHAAHEYRSHTARLGVWDNEYCADVQPARKKLFVCKRK